MLKKVFSCAIITNLVKHISVYFHNFIISFQLQNLINFDVCIHYIPKYDTIYSRKFKGDQIIKKRNIPLLFRNHINLGSWKIIFFLFRII